MSCQTAYSESSLFGLSQTFTQRTAGGVEMFFSSFLFSPDSFTLFLYTCPYIPSPALYLSPQLSIHRFQCLIPISIPGIPLTALHA